MIIDPGTIANIWSRIARAGASFPAADAAGDLWARVADLQNKAGFSAFDIGTNPVPDLRFSYGFRGEEVMELGQADGRNWYGSLMARGYFSSGAGTGGSTQFRHDNSAYRDEGRVIRLTSGLDSGNYRYLVGNLALNVIESGRSIPSQLKILDGAYGFNALRCEFKFLPPATTNVSISVGWASNVTAHASASNKFVGISYDTAFGSAPGNWHYLIRSGGADSANADSGVAAAANVPVRGYVQWTNGEVKMALNGGAEQTFTAGLPTPAADQQIAIWVVTRTSASRWVDVVYLYDFWKKV